jgi:small subunit ribosomal protein S16
MIKLRLKRLGKKREVSYRIVAMNSYARRDGRALAELGFYNPRTNETRLDVPHIDRYGAPPVTKGGCVYSGEFCQCGER